MLYLFLLAVCSNRRLLLASAVCAAVVVWQIRIIPYYYYQNTTGTLYEKYYKAPAITAADFPAQKRNLLLLYLESVENNFADASLYGRNLLPQLSEIAKRNPRFDGYSFLYGTNYTKAALVAGHWRHSVSLAGTDNGKHKQSFEKYPLPVRHPCRQRL